MVLLSVNLRAIAFRIPECGMSVKLPVGMATVVAGATCDVTESPLPAIAASTSRRTIRPPGPVP